MPHLPRRLDSIKIKPLLWSSKSVSGNKSSAEDYQYYRYLQQRSSITSKCSWSCRKMLIRRELFALSSSPLLSNHLQKAQCNEKEDDLNCFKGFHNFSITLIFSTAAIYTFWYGHTCLKSNIIIYQGKQLYYHCLTHTKSYSPTRKFKLA